MAPKLYPIQYNPGILRDGTGFQNQYCIDGDWIRFQNGKVKKMGGQYEIKLPVNNQIINNLKNVSLLKHYRYLNNRSILLLGDNSGLFIVTDNNNIFPIVKYDNINYKSWQSIQVETPNKEKHIIGLAKPQDFLFYTTNNSNKIVSIPIDNINGLLYVHPTVFLYGDSGLVKYSSNTNPFEFDITKDDTAGELNISDEDIIYGANTRGNDNPPCLLFWTTNSVIYLTNKSNTDTYEFHPQVISTSSSILSNKCVVEYDGFFYWLGLNKFYVYNGIVSPLPNNFNLNYLFDNLNYKYLDKIFAVKNTKYNEIWWFYPTKDSEECNRAIIYNVLDKVFYDTVISRTSGNTDLIGNMITFGKSKTDNTYSSLWTHDVGLDEVRQDKTIYPINSFFTSPYLSWVSFSNEENSNYLLKLTRIEPDFKNTIGGVAEPDMSIAVNSLDYANSPVEKKNLGSINLLESKKLDIRVEARNINFTFSSKADFEMGNTLIVLDQGNPIKL